MSAPDLALRLIVAALATWRLSVALYDGDLFGPLRYRMGAYLTEDERGFWGSQLACFWCVTQWVALPCGVLALLPWDQWLILIWPALSGAAMLLAGGQRIVWHLITDGNKE